MRIHEVRGGGGLRLHVREWGSADGAPVLFIHGWSQCHLYWGKQYESSLADESRLVAYDLRGHGMSEAPLEPEHYTEARHWADDVAAIIEALELEQAMLVGHSYAPIIICDYLRAYGQEAIGGLHFVGGLTHLGQEAARKYNGPGFLDHFAGATDEDLPTNIQSIRAFLRALPAEPLTREELETALAWNMVVPARVREHLTARQVDSDDVPETLDVPLLVTHGRADTAVLPAMAEHVLRACPTAEASWYEGVGHLPNLEKPERFNRELREFMQGVQ